MKTCNHTTTSRDQLVNHIISLVEVVARSNAQVCLAGGHAARMRVKILLASAQCASTRSLSDHACVLIRGLDARMPNGPGGVVCTPQGNGVPLGGVTPALCCVCVRVCLCAKIEKKKRGTRRGTKKKRERESVCVCVIRVQMEHRLGRKCLAGREWRAPSLCVLSRRGHAEPVCELCVLCMCARRVFVCAWGR